MNPKIIDEEIAHTISAIDKQLSRRFISLDPKGYFIIKVELSTKEIIVEQYSNDIDDLGRALDPDNGKPLQCNGSKERLPIKIYRGRTAKEVGIEITEGNAPLPISRIDHALYLGRELQRAEDCLLRRKRYLQD